MQLVKGLQLFIKEHPYAFKKFGIILGMLFWSSQHLLIISIFRITDPRSLKSITLGKWLQVGIETLPPDPNTGIKPDKEKLVVVYNRYQDLLKQDIYKVICDIRHKHYAHHDIDKPNIKDFTSPTWDQLFGFIIELQLIYQQASATGYCPGTSWKPIILAPYFSGDFNDLIREFLLPIEKSCEAEKLSFDMELNE